VLAAVLLDSGFRDSVGHWLSEGGDDTGIRQLTVEELDERGGGGVEVFRLGLHRRGYAAVPGTESRYWEVSRAWNQQLEIIPEEDL
jgi:hypothetical protein